jgi:hypothetical protein
MAPQPASIGLPASRWPVRVPRAPRRALVAVRGRQLTWRPAGPGFTHVTVFTSDYSGLEFLGLQDVCPAKVILVTSSRAPR